MQNMYAPMAQAVRSQGRGDDSMLIHMTPGEVGGLQALAMASGGSLSINPETGLPEAGFLKNILPTILGLGLAATGVGAPLAAGLVAGGTTLATGDLGKGLMAGLGAFGGASLAGGIGIGGKLAGGDAFGMLGDKAGIFGSNMGAGIQPVSNILPTVGDASALAQQSLSTTTPEVLKTAAEGGIDVATKSISPAGGAVPDVLKGAVQNPISQINLTTAESVARPFSATLGEGSGFLGKFGQDFAAASRQGLPGGIAQKAAPYLAGYGVVEPLMRPPEMEVMDSEEDEFEIPEYGQRRLRPRLDPNYPEGEISFFDPSGFQRTGRSVYSSVDMAEGDEVPAPTRGLGATLAAQLPEYTRMFQTSPGPVSGVPFGYGAGQAPSEQIRARLLNQPIDADVGMIQPGREPTFDIAEAPRNRFGNLALGGLGNLAGLGNLGAYGDFDFSNMDFSNLGSMVGGTNISSTAPINRARGAAQPQPQPRPQLTQFSPEPMPIESGGFVMPARETAEFGNGSTMAGQDILAQLGGMPIQGPGDGVSDSIPAMIDGEQPAALADGETYFPPQTVEAMGGADQLRKMMEQAQTARQKADRGEESPMLYYTGKMGDGPTPEALSGFENFQTMGTPKPMGLAQRPAAQPKPRDLQPRYTYESFRR
jgi:hypothetical protein